MADDYMSDALLGPAPRVSPAVQRLRDRCRGPVKPAPLSLIESDKRAEGLNAPIPADNKGFQLLAQMGYRPGVGLGRQQGGATAAIPLVIKRDRQGLGADGPEQTKAQRLQAHVSVDDFRRHKRDQQAAKLLRREFRKYLAMCQELDVAGGVVGSPYADVAALRRAARSRRPGPTEGAIYAAADGRRVVLAHLKEEAVPRAWRCISLPDLRPTDVPEHSLQARECSPPEAAAAEPAGVRRAEELAAAAATAAATAAGCAPEGEESLDDEDLRALWPDLAAYLRTAHAVCVHCGAQYDDAAQLAALCPGPTLEDHDAEGTLGDDD